MRAVRGQCVALLGLFRKAWFNDKSLLDKRWLKAGAPTLLEVGHPAKVS